MQKIFSHKTSVNINAKFWANLFFNYVKPQNYHKKYVTELQFTTDKSLGMTVIFPLPNSRQMQCSQEKKIVIKEQP